MVRYNEIVEDKIKLKSVGILITPTDFLELKGVSDKGIITIKRWASTDEFDRAEAENLKREILAGNNTKYQVVKPDLDIQKVFYKKRKFI